MNRPDADAVLLAWYPAVCDEWATGARKDENPGTDMGAFWRARYDERWPPSKPSADPNAKLPAWAQRGLANLKAGQS